MAGFDDIKIGWKGEEFTVPPTRALGLLGAIEEVLAPNQSQSVIDLLARPHMAHQTKIARAYAVALRYAGAQVSDEAVYLSLAREVQKGGVEGFKALRTLSDGLMAMFFPEWALTEMGNGQGGDSTTEDGQSAPTATSSAVGS